MAHVQTGQVCASITFLGRTRIDALTVHGHLIVPQLGLPRRVFIRCLEDPVREAHPPCPCKMRTWISQVMRRHWVKCLIRVALVCCAKETVGSHTRFLGLGSLSARSLCL